MSRHPIFFLTAILLAATLSAPASARQNTVMRGAGNTASNRQAVQAPAQSRDVSQDEVHPAMSRTQSRQETKTQTREDRVESFCTRGEDMIGNMKQRNLPAELVSMAEHQLQERCDMNRRQLRERKTLLEQLRKQGVQLSPDDGLAMDDEL